MSQDQVVLLEETIARLEAQRALLGDAVIDAALAPLRQKLAALRQTTPDTPASALSGERKLVTILFADISGFTALSERLDAEAARDLMNACFERLVPAIEKYEGTVDKFLGDGVMALFGAPITHENDAHRAVRAALEMSANLEAFNREHQVDLGIHFGLNTGMVVAGGIGTAGQQEYSVMGDAVNVASRLEQVSERGQILVGPDTFRLTQARFEFEALAPVRVKGKSEPLPIYRVIGPRAVPGRERGIAGLESPLVGRQAEFQTLQQAVARLAGGQGGIVTLVGEAGLGKSRLVAELRHGLPAGPVQWVEGRCISYGASIPYLPWLEALRSLLGLSPEDAPAAARRSLQEQVQALCPADSSALVPVLARLLSLPLEAAEEANQRNLSGEQLKAATFQAVEQVLAGAARARPLVVVVEDLHWADPTSLELLAALVPLVERVPILFLCPARPEKEHGSFQFCQDVAGRYAAHHTGITLEPLSPEESRTLVSNLLAVEDLPSELRQRILDHAEGNPFYVEEIVRSLLDGGLISYQEETGRWIATRPMEEIVIPDTLQGVLMARIDRLQEETRHVLQLAAVIGRVFFYRVLAAIAREEEQLDGHLHALQQQEMIRERARMPELEYIFKHHLMQEAAYNGLLKKDRRAFHRQVAVALEKLFPDRRQELIGLLAFHWERAEETGPAVACLLEAGDQARLAYSHQEAIDYYRRALALLQAQGDQARAARTLIKLGLAYHTAFDFSRSRQAYAEGFALLQQVGLAPVGRLPPPPHALRMYWGSDPPTLDPTLADDTSSIIVLSQLFSGLVRLNVDGDVLPNAACSWQVLDDGRRAVFALREDVRWSDGVPVTAADFEYAWKRVLDPQVHSRAALLLYDLKGGRPYHLGQAAAESVGVRALDDHTLQVELEEPCGYLLHLLTCTAFSPLPRHVVAAHGAAWTEPGRMVSCGPFVLDSWTHGERMTLRRNPHFHGPRGGNVECVELDLRQLPHPAVLEMYAAQQFDLLPGLGQMFEQARQRFANDYVSGPAMATGYVGFNLAAPPFQDQRVRLALALTVERERLSGVARQGQSDPAHGGFVPPGMPGHSPDIGLPGNPEEARLLLAAAGYPGGRGFPALHVVIHDNIRPIFQHLQAQWREQLGIQLDGSVISWGDYLQVLQHEPPAVYIMLWVADYPDPDNFLRVGFCHERVHWHDPDFIQLVEQARRVTEQRERIRLYQQADRLLGASAVLVPLFYGREHGLLKPWIRRVQLLGFNQLAWQDLVIEPHE